MSYQSIQEPSSFQPTTSLSENSKFSVKRVLILVAFVIGVLVGGVAVSNKDTMMSAVPSLRSSTELDVSATVSSYNVYLGSTVSVSSSSYLYTFLASTTCTATSSATYLYPGDLAAKVVGTKLMTYASATSCVANPHLITTIVTSTPFYDSYTKYWVIIESA